MMAFVTRISRQTDLIIVPTAGMDVEALCRQHAPLVPWLRRWRERGAAVAGVCTGVSLLAEAGLLEGRDATTHFRGDIRFDNLAARVGMSPRNFARRFKVATGDTPISYLHRLRIADAKQLLETEFKTIQEVSLSVGYEDLAFFRRLFKRYTGTPPQEYRRRFGVRRNAALA